MTDKDEEIARLILENGRLKKLTKLSLKPCKSCANLRQLDCWTLFECPYLGIVNPEEDGCTKHKEKRKAQGRHAGM